MNKHYIILIFFDHELIGCRVFHNYDNGIEYIKTIESTQHLLTEPIDFDILKNTGEFAAGFGHYIIVED